LPAFTVSSWWPMWWQISSSRAMANWLTDWVPYTGTLETGMPFSFA